MSLPTQNLVTLDDFLQSEDFRVWMRERRPEDQLRWKTWLAEHPDRQEVYEQAVATFLVLQGTQHTISDKAVKDRVEQVIQQLPPATATIRPFSNWQWGRWVAAATVAGLIGWWQLGFPLFDPLSVANTPPKQATKQDAWKLVKNSTGQALVVILPDSSSVLLSTGSQLRYRKQNSGSVREVYLQGEGFFEVTKNPEKPFIVYAPNLTTKVLGTSFQVRAFRPGAASFVKVKTGRVTVTSTSSPTETVLLTANEEANLKTSHEHFVKHETLSADNTDRILKQQFTFEYTPVHEILNRLEESYNMPIQYDRAALSNCTFTGQLNDVPFLEKIRLLCLATESTFDVTDNLVIIHSRGCK
ncbi:FecR family protein [Spirosoma sp. 209]|uniref:FecR family protein n=1 Tax=Spirosoma sp. 209 TaxID=1955701 RepID=UPI00098D6B04|nr:FecR family protein [Spirosoma sp. 209]